MENITVLGAGGFIGTNLALYLLEKNEQKITLIDRRKEYLANILKTATKIQLNSISIKENELNSTSSFDTITKGQDVIYHLVSSTTPSTANQNISQELADNVIMTNNLLESCVKNNVKKVVFLSSGGTVYGKSQDIPFKENTPTFPINSYGLQKITIEKLLFLYSYLYNLEYRIVRLSNPYGPYQRPNAGQGFVTTCIYQALTDEPVTIYGDGSVIRDYIYIDDAIKGIHNIANADSTVRTYNLGTGIGYTINDVIEKINIVLKTELKVNYVDKRKADVPINILNMERYRRNFLNNSFLNLEDGILKTAEFLREKYAL